MAVSHDNPFGIEDFDHRAFASMPEYRHLAEAMEVFVHRAADDGAALAQPEWLDAVRHIAASLSFPSTCDAAHSGDRLVYPHAAHVGGDGVLMTYRCPACGEAWSKLWALGPTRFL